MIKDLDAFIAHLKKTGRMKLLPQVLRELKESEARERLTAPRKETAKENPALISGWREIADGKLTDRTGKRALLEIYKKITQ
jgi:hypothetical protein